MNRIVGALLKKVGRQGDGQDFGRPDEPGPVLQCRHCDGMMAVTETVMAVVTAGEPICCSYCGSEFQRWSPG
jgi:hypothetical protein